MSLPAEALGQDYASAPSQQDGELSHALPDSVDLYPETGSSSGRFLLPSLWSRNTSATSLGRSQPSERPLEHTEAGQRATTFRQLIDGSARGLFSHRHTQSSSSRTSLSPQPVIVRTNSYGSSRPQSRTRPATLPQPQEMPAVRLPSIEEFRFEGILRAIQPQIQQPLEEIAEILGRSRMSLADEYGSHLPPQAEVGQTSETAQARTARPYDAGLPAVQEASSSSERLDGSGNSSQPEPAQDAALSTGSPAYQYLGKIATKTALPTGAGNGLTSSPAESIRMAGPSVTGTSRTFPAADEATEFLRHPVTSNPVQNSRSKSASSVLVASNTDSGKNHALVVHSPMSLTAGQECRRTSSPLAATVSNKADDREITQGETTLISPGGLRDEDPVSSVATTPRRSTLVQNLAFWLGLNNRGNQELESQPITPPHHKRGISTAQRSLRDVLSRRETALPKGKHVDSGD